MLFPVAGIPCNPPEDHATFNPGFTSFSQVAAPGWYNGDVVTYTCPPGYYIVETNTTTSNMECLTTGQWGWHANYDLNCSRELNKLFQYSY